MGIRLLLAATAALALAACADSSTAPRRMAPGGALKEVLTCRSGYHIATRADGTEYCEPDPQPLAAEGPTGLGETGTDTTSTGF